ncbi:MAG: efflux RND transporter permease subunit [Agathobacter sp.]
MVSKYSVRKPYTVLVAVLLVIVLGVVSLMKMTTDLLPDMSFQYALVMTTDVGASPEQVESDVTAPIEAAMATTSNIKNITSTSYNSYSMVVLEYEQSANMDSVVIEIQQKLDQLSGSFPDSVGTPMIMQINPDMLPIMIAAVDMDGMSEAEITEYVNNDLIPSLESVEGVASVTANGGLEETIEVTMNQEKIDALNEKIENALNEKFDEAQSELDEAADKIEDGKNAMADGQKEMVSQIGSGSNEITNNKIDLANKKAELESQLSSLQSSYNSIDSAVTSLSATYSGASQLQSGIDSLNQGIASIKDARNAGYKTGYDLAYQDAYNSQYPTIRATIKKQFVYAAVRDSDPAMENLTDAEIQTYLDGTTGLEDAFGAGIESNSTLVAQLNAAAVSGASAAADAQATISGNQYADMAEKKAFDALNAQMGTSYSSLAELQDQVTSLNATLNDINMQLAGQSGNFAEMGITLKSYKDIPNAITKLQGSKSSLSEGITALQDGLKQISDGQEALSDASVSLAEGEIDGILQMANGYTDLVDAASQLASGQAQLDEAKESALESADLNNILTVQMLSQLLVAQNFDMPAGYAYDGDKQYLVRVGESVDTIEELRDLVLMDFGTDEVGIIRLSDVAEIEVVDNSGENYAIINGNPGIMLSIEKQTGYSTGDVTDRLLDKFDSMENANEVLHLSVLMNQGIYIDIVVKSVFQNMIFGAILAIFVLLLFLKDIKPTLVIACSIPLSVIVAVVLMYFTGITMNIISMSGLVLGIGMLVDNSIVVIENIYRLRGEGYSIKKAAVEGASQVTGAIIASTLTTISVYAPIIFTEGITRQLFVDLALTIAFTLVASLAVALTFVPAMSSAILKKTKEIRHPWFDRFKDWYGKALDVCLRFKPIVFVLAIVLLFASAALSLSKGLNFMDMDMETNQLSVTITAKEDEKLEFDELVECSNEVIERISDIEGIDTIGAMAGGGSVMSMMGGSNSDSVSMYILLDEDSDASIYDVADEIESRTSDMNCLVTTETNSMDMTSMMGSGISVQIKGRDLDTLQELAATVAGIVENTEGTMDVENGLDNTSAEFTITVDKEKAAEYGYTVAQVFQLVYAEMADTASATTISSDIKDYEVYVQTEVQSDAQLSDIKALTFTYTNEDGEEEEIPLTDICTMSETTTLSTIEREAQTRYLTVSAAIDEDHNITLVSNEIQKQIDKMDIPEGYSVSMKGEDETINDAMSQLVLMLLLAVIFIYLIMVAQFQSLLSPFIIMFSIPLAFTGGFLALFLTGQEVSVIAMLGFIMLAGLIVNNGIVLIDYINQARREGMSKKDAIIDSGKTRLRPILMTAFTTILAMLTSAVGIGEGSEMMKPMAITIVGGLLYGTILTLIVIPCLYDAFNREKSMVEEEL